jgi:hypothetical protein
VRYIFLFYFPVKFKYAKSMTKRFENYQEKDNKTE